MTYKIIKSNLVVFGKFYFPPIPQTMIQLMQAFQSHRMMPQILNVVEGTGKPSQRVSLFRHEDGMSIWFADNRIDITQNSLTNCLATDDFLKVASELLNSLSNLGYRYSRVGLAVETLLERGHQGDYEELRERFLPVSSPNSSEWSARWVDEIHSDDEKLNVCYDLQRMAGLFVTNQEEPVSFDGVKITYDVSTSPANTVERFSNADLSSATNAIMEIINHQRNFVGVSYE